MWLAGVETLRRKLTVRPSMGVSLKAAMGLGLPGAAQLVLAIQRHESLAIPRQDPDSTTLNGSGRDQGW
jgi:hypothetical protein